MLTATLDGLVERFSLEGERLGEVVAGAVLEARARPRPHARVRARLQARARDARLRRPAGLRHGPGDRRSRSRTRSRSGRSTSGSRAASTRRPTRRSRSTRTCARSCWTSTARSRCPAARRPLARLRPGQIVPEIPRNAEPRTGLSMGEHAAHTAAEWGIARAEQDELAVASHRTWPPRTTAASTTTWSRRTSGSSATRTCGRLDGREAGEAQAGLRRRDGTMTAGNSTPLTDGASAVLLASEEWAAARGCRCWRTSSTRRPRPSTTCTRARGC